MRGLTTAIAALLLTSLAGCERWELDRKMEELCKQDGGIKVYETVTLPESEFSDTGQPLGRYWTLDTPQEDRLGPAYRYVERIEILVGERADMEKGQGRLIRTYQAIYRRSDERLLGRSISYGRGGGDGFTFGFQPSGNYCPKPRKNIISSIFIRER